MSRLLRNLRKRVTKKGLERENRKNYSNDKGKELMKEGNKEKKRKNKDVNSKGCLTCGGPHLS